MEPLENLRKIRLGKLEIIKKLGIDPYPAKSEKKHTVVESLKSHGKNVQTAGRILGLRGHGGSTFADLVDESGKIQLFFSSSQLSTVNRQLLTLLDIGDFIQVSGKVDKTQAGEITIFVSDFKLLTKSIRPLPSTWFKLKDVEERNRKRYLDLLINEGVKDVFDARSKVVYAIRRFLVEKKGYVEVEEPALQPLYGGTRARPFKTHHNSLNVDLYLRISNELYLKRLIVGGFEKVFEIGHTFRNEGMDRYHNPEFTILETMAAYADYTDNMDLVEEMFEFVAKEVFKTTKLKYQNWQIDYKRPWQRIKLADLFKKYTGVHIHEIDTLEKATKLAKKLGVEVKDFMTDGEILLEIFEKKCTTELIQPTFVYDYPADFYPLAKPKRDNPKFVESFDVYVAGMEMGTNYSEQNDPQALREAWTREKEKIKAGNLEAQVLDEDFLEALEYGMPPTSGIGPGIDRWVMVMADSSSISDVILFPTLRPSRSSTRDSITAKQDFSKKIVLVIDKSLKDWQVLNTVAHTSAYIGNKISDKFDTGESFNTQDGIKHPRNSQFPIVVLSATKDQIKDLIEKVREENLLHIGFIKEMIETTNDEKIVKILANKTEKDVEYLGVGFFEEKDNVEELTKQFKLWE